MSGDDRPSWLVIAVATSAAISLSIDCLRHVIGPHTMVLAAIPPLMLIVRRCVPRTGES
jgi:hypothetical protein